LPVEETTGRVPPATPAELHVATTQSRHCSW
jgi:hypothetical protein